MTEDELKEKMRALGIDPENPSWVKSKSVDLGKIPFVVSQREAMSKMADLLEAQAASDESQIQALQESLARLKRGGGV